MAPALDIFRQVGCHTAGFPTSWIGHFSVSFRLEHEMLTTSFTGDLDLSGYQVAMTGSARGLAIVPGESHISLLIRCQVGGNHPGQFKPEELMSITHWIELGTPE